MRPALPCRCGTHAGYVCHKRRKEIACDACKTAEAAYRKGRRVIARGRK